MMRPRKIVAAVLFAAASAFAPSQISAFTATLPISGYEFETYLHIYESDVGALEGVYTVPAGRIAVVTDVYIALDSGASGTHKTFISNNLLTRQTGPFLVTATSPFSKAYTSGLVFLSGETIVASDTGGTGNVTINLNGFVVCPVSCD